MFTLVPGWMLKNLMPKSATLDAHFLGTGAGGLVGWCDTPLLQPDLLNGIEAKRK